ncbi:amidohydrolase [Chengkuizengella axinellae]|uniref:5-methylthioadenosine/S-adenosylhomocysteine deaminase n=1 Tax=Chengkuizengella axinellae TaxID=3064388 RepID=A0ABT9IWZ0_9BACL|nr:amidohydrolase [Chengkuizengella sp. 2205SS18-9]MDP5273843.1 amidohydrolase [Chengkuizengella sp. 2205SS18-9]
MKLLIKNGTFVTMNGNETIRDGYMVVENDLIQYIGKNKPIVESEYDEIIDGKNRIYMPGLVNTHNHAAMSLLRGYADDLALQVWLEDNMWPMEAKFTNEDVKWGTHLSILEMIKGGTTSFVDMYDHMDEVAQAVEVSGMRACLTRGMIGFGGEEVQDAKLKEARAFANDWHEKADGRITAMMSPHAPYTCPPEFIEKIVQAAQELQLPIHTHMSETQHEVMENEKQYGLRPVAHLQKLGVFDQPCLVAHAVHLTDEEISILKEHSVHVSHNPGSNLKLASGIARLPELKKAGVLVSLGTDSAASNNNLDMFEEVRLAALIHKGNTYDPTAIPAIEALRLGTIDGAKSIWLNDVGMLKEGMKADFISLNSNQAHFLPKSDVISHIVYSAGASDVQDVWVNGKQLVKNKELLTMDEEKIKFEFNARFERLTN